MNIPRFILLLLLAYCLCCFFSEAQAIYTARIEEMEVSYHLGPTQLLQTDAWLSCDGIISSIYLHDKADAFTQINTDPLDTIILPATPLPNLLIPQIRDSFLVVYPEQTVTFEVEYCDDYGNPPSAGYPRALYWREGTSEVTAVSLECITPSTYRKALLLPPGTYWYKYAVKNDYLPEEYCLEKSSFTVSQRPLPVANTGIKENAVVSNSKVTLHWTSGTAENGEQLHYTLYFGCTPDTLSAVYEGNNNTFTLTCLEFNRQYYWKVAASNTAGVTSLSAIYTFATIPPIPKPFNYPNPFNPSIGQKTNIVFTMPEAGRAEVFILTELGDLCWRRPFENLFPGVNEAPYDGNDDNGNRLYNGTYICLIKKHYGNREEQDRCRILVIK